MLIEIRSRGSRAVVALACIGLFTACDSESGSQEEPEIETRAGNWGLVLNLPIQVATDAPERPYVLLASVDGFNLQAASAEEEVFYAVGLSPQQSVYGTDGQVWAVVSEPIAVPNTVYSDFPVITGPLVEGDDAPYVVSYLPLLHSFCSERCAMEFRFAWGSREELEASGELADPNGPSWIASRFDYVAAERAARNTTRLIDGQTWETEGQWGTLRADLVGETLNISLDALVFRYID